uniref:Uncharacterized protein n=1 Tax=Hucho hucho TaxID=62062 RepID=A0A4W5Q1M9_9TELE
MRMKKLTLDINERQEQEDYQEMMASLAQRPAPANTNRERRPRYQHPKGAPNADLIFKTGGRKQETKQERNDRHEKRDRQERR